MGVTPGLDIIDRIAQVATDGRDRPVMDVRILGVVPVGETLEAAKANGYKSKAIKLDQNAKK